MLVANQRAVTLQRFIKDDSDAHDIMDEEQHNPPQTVRHEIWLLLLKVCGNREPMIFKPGGNLNHVQTRSVTNDRALNPFVWDEVILPTKIQYVKCKRRVKNVRDGQVEQLHNQVKLVGSVLDSHEPGIGYVLYPRDHDLVSPHHILLFIRRPSNNLLTPVQL